MKRLSCKIGVQWPSPTLLKYQQGEKAWMEVIEGTEKIKVGFCSSGCWMFERATMSLRENDIPQPVLQICSWCSWKHQHQDAWLLSSKSQFTIFLLHIWAIVAHLIMKITIYNHSIAGEYISNEELLVGFIVMVSSTKKAGGGSETLAGSFANCSASNICHTASAQLVKTILYWSGVE